MTNFCLKALCCYDRFFLFLTLLPFLTFQLNRGIYGFELLSSGGSMFCILMGEILQELHPFVEQIMPIYLPCICAEGKSTDSWTASLFCAPVVWLRSSKNLCSSGLKSCKREGVHLPPAGSSTPTLYMPPCSGEVLWCNFGFLEANSSQSSSWCGSQYSAECPCRAGPERKDWSKQNYSH